MKNRMTTLEDGTPAYVTIDGDVVDMIAHAHYGSHMGTTELVLEANRELSELGPVLPAGLLIKLPYRPVTPETKTFRRLWD